MSAKWWCLFGVHEYRVIDSGPYELRDAWGSVRNVQWMNLQCNCCGKVKYRKLV